VSLRRAPQADGISPHLEGATDTRAVVAGFSRRPPAAARQSAVTTGLEMGALAPPLASLSPTRAQSVGHFNYHEPVGVLRSVDERYLRSVR